MDLSIIIVNWNSASFVKPCLASILANKDDLEIEILVVDNGSHDGCGEMIAREFPQVRFIELPSNLGFAAANNLGFAQSGGRNVLFLNPDTEVIGPVLRRLVTTLDTLPEAGIAGPKLLNTNLSIQTSCIQRFPTILNQMLDAEFLRTKTPRARLWGTRPLFDNPSAPVDVEVVSGASLMVKRRVFESVGMFSSRYFMYSEDVDLCFEIRKAGWKVFYVASGEVVHHSGQSSMHKAESHFSTVLNRESTWRFMRSKRGAMYAAAYSSSVGVAAVCRLILLTAAAPLMLSRSKQGKLVAAFAKWLKVLRWAMNLERWAEIHETRKAQPGATRIAA